MRQKLLVALELSDEQRALARLGDRWSKRIRSAAYWTWASESLTQGQWLRGTKQLRHALVEFGLSYL